MSTAGWPEPAFPAGELSTGTEPQPEPEPQPAAVAQPQAEEIQAAGPHALAPDAELLGEIGQVVRTLAAQTERYHARAEQREAVIDHLRSEVDRLRRGERRSVLRPLLVEICRLRNDLLRQAEELPDDFDATRARLLLRSYAESAELALEGSGVITYSAEAGECFEPRLHRRVGGQPATERVAEGRIASVRRSGYLDAEGGTPIELTEVVVFVWPGPPEAEQAAARDERTTP
jgi:molecular chaperone GrpE (heat shock protein)